MNVLTSVAPLRYPARELSGRGWTPARLLAGCLISLMWLPVGFYAAGAAGAGNPPWLADLDGWLYLAGLALGGVPLVWACGRLRRMGYPGAAWMAFGVLAPATVMGSVYVAPLGPLWVAALCRGSELAGLVALRAGMSRPSHAAAEFTAHRVMKMVGSVRFLRVTASLVEFVADCRE